MKTVTVLILLTLTGCVNMKTPVALNKNGYVDMVYNYSTNELPKVIQKTVDSDAKIACVNQGYKTATHVKYGGNKVCIKDWAMGCSVFRVSIRYKCE